MKKFIFVSSFLLLGSLVYAQENIEEPVAESIPTLEAVITDTDVLDNSAAVDSAPVDTVVSSIMEFPVHSENDAFVFSLSDSVRHVEDEIILINHSLKTNLAFRVEVYNPKKKDWVRYGTSTLTKVNDTDRVKSRHSGNLAKFSHAAVIPETKGLNFKAFRNKDNFLVYVEQPENTISMDNIVTIEKDNGKFRDNIRFINNSESISDTAFVIYGISGDLKLFLGTAYLTTLGDTCFVRSYHDVTAFTHYEISSENSIPFKLETYCKKNDMYVVVLTDAQNSETISESDSAAVTEEE